MKNKYIGLLIITLVLILSLTLIPTEECEKTTLVVSGESGYYSVMEIADDIETNQYYKGYNKTTLEWFKTLDGVVVPSPEGFVVMSKSDAESIPIESVTDVIIEDTISCNIIEKRSLGDNLTDIIDVNNVELISQETKALWA